VTIYVEDHQASEWVTLSEYEVDFAIQVGVRIWRDSQADGRSDRDGWVGFQGDGGKRRQALGSLCENIASACLGIHWPMSVNQFGEPDLPHNVEVRLIGLPHYGLRVYPRNDNSRRVVGVVVPPGEERAGTYRVAGWYLAGDGKRAEWQMSPHDRPPMFAVPQSVLRHPSELRMLIAHEVIAREERLASIRNGRYTTGMKSPTSLEGSG
jgi:hypothetical protein